MLAPILMLALVGQYVGATDLFVTASVEVQVPSGKPVITYPENSSKINSGEIAVSGTCPLTTPSVIIALYENASLRGSASCSVDGYFSIPVTFSNGHHTIVATVITITNQIGQSSDPIEFTSRPKPAPSIAGESSLPAVEKTVSLPLPIVVHSRDTFLTIKSNGTVTWHGSISGGAPPYLLTVDWGDGKTDTLKVVNNAPMTLTHTYAVPRIYDIVFRVTDAHQDTTIFHSAAITLALQQVGAIDKKNLQLPTMTLNSVEQLAVNTYIVTLSGLTFLWYLQHGHMLVTSIIRSKNVPHVRRRK